MIALVVRFKEKHQRGRVLTDILFKASKMIRIFRKMKTRKITYVAE